MVKLSSAGLVAAFGGLALSLGVGSGMASADPVINTTCSYSQAVAALNDQSPAAAAEFNQSATAQAWLRSFLGSAPAQRQVMLNQVQAIRRSRSTRGWWSPSQTPAAITRHHTVVCIEESGIPRMPPS